MENVIGLLSLIIWFFVLFIIFIFCMIITSISGDKEDEFYNSLDDKDKLLIVQYKKVSRFRLQDFKRLKKGQHKDETIKN